MAPIRATAGGFPNPTTHSMPVKTPTSSEVSMSLSALSKRPSSHRVRLMEFWRLARARRSSPSCKSSWNNTLKVSIFAVRLLVEWDAPVVKFAILVATFKSRSSLHAPLYSGVIQMPTLLVYGEDDKVIPAEMTKDLLPMYVAPQTTLVHPGGHFIPTNAAAKDAYRAFIAPFLSNPK
uniref:FSH1 domain-containing protein n=1 Tax=Mesocestoides corti TaxID=53468 RepID=A0A5K3EV13_MESCO